MNPYAQGMSGEFYDDCTILAAETSPSGLPTSMTGVINLAYSLPIHRHNNFFQILLYGDGVWKDLAPHLIPGSLQMVDRAQMGVSTLKMTIEDMANPSNLPIRILPRMRMQVLNRNGSKLYFKGFLQPPKPDPVMQRPDLTERAYLQVTANDETELFRRALIPEVITSTTEGAMLLDLVARYCPELDASGIDPTLGATIDVKIINRRYLFDLIQEFLNLNPNATFWLERKPWPAKTKVWITRRDHSATLLSQEVTDANVYKLFDRGSFWISRSDKAYKNRVILQYYELYNTGTVNVSQGDKIIYGFGTDWLGKVFSGDTFRLPGSDSTYSVDHINATAPGVEPVVQEIHITSEFQEPDATGTAYEVIRRQISEEIAEDLSEIEALKSLNEEPGELGGVREVIIPPGPNPLLKAEAERLSVMLLRFNLYEGGATTNNVLLPEGDLWAGRTQRINRPLMGVQDDLILQEVTLRDGKGRPSSFATNRPHDPYLLISIKYTDRLFSEESRFQAMLLEMRRPKVKDTSTLTVNKSIPERAYFADCVGASEGEPVDESALFADAIASAEVDTVGPWYASPTAGGKKPIRACGLNSFFRAS